MLSSNPFAPERCATAIVEMTRTLTDSIKREDEEGLSGDLPSFREYECSSRPRSQIDQNRFSAIAFVVPRLGGRRSHSNPRSSEWGIDRHLRLRSKLMRYVRLQVVSIAAVGQLSGAERFEDNMQSWQDNDGATG
jgi:hypothetical protein